MGVSPREIGADAREGAGAQPRGNEALTGETPVPPLMSESRERAQRRTRMGASRPRLARCAIPGHTSRSAAPGRCWMLAAVMLLCTWMAGAARAQTDGAGAAGDLERMVREGMVAALESRFTGVRSIDQLRMLALAQSNKAARIRDDRRRQREFQDAERRFLAWINAADHQRGADRILRAVNGARARHAYGGMILSQWAVVELDQFELTRGKQGDTRRLRSLLSKASDLYEEAWAAIEPLAAQLADADPEVEENYLALGVYDSISRLELDIRFNRAWANLYSAMVDSRRSVRRGERLRTAERDFQELIDSGQSGQTASRCNLGLAMTLREQGRNDEAAPYFAKALEGADGAAGTAQVRYERARSEINAGRFEEARITLRPLLEKNPDRLKPADLPARFYINLAHLWEAVSFLEQAAALEKTAKGSTARQAVLLRARRARETGLRKMSRLSSRGGGWPALVQLYIADAIDLNADITKLSPAELLFTASHFSRDKKYRHALRVLKEAAGRKDVGPRLAGDILFELGVCHYRCRETRAAAEVFDRLSREYKNHEKALQAVTYAYQLWATIAEQSGRREDYRRLADVILNLLRSFPEHEQRDEAAWWLPVALQAAGDYDAAIRQYDAIRDGSPQYEEAQYRKVVCARLKFEEQRAALSPLKLRAGAKLVTDELKAYARRAYQRAAQTPNAQKVLGWAAAAVVSAAEVHVMPGVDQHQRALDLLADFEQRYPNSKQMGRVLAVRINAYRGLEQFDQAARVVEQFLQTVSPEQAGGTLGVVARGMQEEVERLERAGDQAAARRLAKSSIQTFEQLEKWVRAEPSRAKYVDAVQYGLARMRLVAGEQAAARQMVANLLAREPRNGNYQRLNALVLTADADEDPTPEHIAAAREAWAGMLRDPSLRTAAPERYWEARYHHLALLLREGKAAEVERAIRQERIWYPELGGEPWTGRLSQLYEQAASQLGGAPTPESQPAASRPTEP